MSKEVRHEDQAQNGERTKSTHVHLRSRTWCSCLDPQNAPLRPGRESQSRSEGYCSCHYGAQSVGLLTDKNIRPPDRRRNRFYAWERRFFHCFSAFRLFYWLATKHPMSNEDQSTRNLCLLTAKPKQQTTDRRSGSRAVSVVLWSYGFSSGYL